LFVKADRQTTKAFNRSENVVGWFGPSERLWVGVSGLDVRFDRALEFDRRSVRSVLDLLFRQEREEG